MANTNSAAETSATSEHSVINLEQSPSILEVLIFYVVPGAVGVVVVIITVTMVIGIIHCKRCKLVPATTSSTLHFDNNACYDSM